MNINIEPIPRKEVEPWLLNKHYAHSIPCLQFTFGLFDKGALEGVCCFGNPANKGNSKLGDYDQIELVRLVVNEGLFNNTLSYFVSQCLKQLPKPLSIISYADSSQGHHGYIYQATNWYYTGKSTCVSCWVDKEGKFIHNRSMSLYRDKYPHLSRTDVAHKLGFKKIVGASKHRYFYFVGNKKDKRKWFKELTNKYTILPYPKGENRRYDIPKDTVKTTSLLDF